MQSDATEGDMLEALVHLGPAQSPTRVAIRPMLMLPGVIMPGSPSRRAASSSVKRGKYWSAART
mgnify:CR=1 FL=1